MEHEILDLIDRYWKFDDNQTPVSNWHDKQDLLEAVRKALRIHDVSGSLGFDKGYEQGYNDATREACQEIAKNYQPNDR